MSLRSLRGGNTATRMSLAFALFFAISPAAFTQQRSTEANAAKGTDVAVDPALKQVVDTYTEAWDRADAHALAMLFTEDCDYVVVGGGDTHGREALETSLARNFTTNMKGSTRTDSIRRVRFLTPDIASLDDYWVLNTPGDAENPRREGYYTWILIRQDGHWLIALHHAASFPAPRPGRGGN
jgi:uncharacterized protein (TIGR02246 family)